MASIESSEEVIRFKCEYGGETKDNIEFRDSGDSLCVSTNDYQDSRATKEEPVEAHMYIVYEDIPELIVWLGARYKEFKED